MAGPVSLQTLGNWKSEVGVRLDEALAVSVDVMGRTGEEACRHALILMAQSARAITPVAKRRREVVDNPNFRHLLRKEEVGSTYKEARMAGRDMSHYFSLKALKLRQPPAEHRELFGNKPGSISKIGNRGLAKRSWMWGLGKLGAKMEGNPLKGAGDAYAVTVSDSVGGYVKENRLSYITKIMPSGWESSAVLKAGNKIMAQARLKMEQQWKAEMSRRGRAVGKGIKSFFKAIS